MADSSKYIGFGVGYGPNVHSIYHYYEELLGMLNLELCNQILGKIGDGNSCRSLIHPYFVSLQEWCRDMYEEMKNDQDKAYFYFRDILVTYQLSKKDSFNEKENNIFHVLISKPISKEGNGIQQMAFVIYEYHNLAINCLQDYVKQLTPSSIIENPPLPPPVPTKIRGFRIQNKDCLEIAFSRLRSLYIIQHDVQQKDFEDAFSGWIPKNKIIWLKGPGLLSYFIKSINGKGIEDEKKNIWTTTISCFQDTNLKNFTVEQLRFAKKPTKTDDIDLVIKSINRNSGD
jgi:hypothetical protein